MLTICVWVRPDAESDLVAARFGWKLHSCIMTISCSLLSLSRFSRFKSASCSRRSWIGRYIRAFVAREKHDALLEWLIFILPVLRPRVDIVPPGVYLSLKVLLGRKAELDLYL